MSMIMVRSRPVRLGSASPSAGRLASRPQPWGATVESIVRFRILLRAGRAGGGYSTYPAKAVKTAARGYPTAPTHGGQTGRAAALHANGDPTRPRRRQICGSCARPWRIAIGHTLPTHIQLCAPNTHMRCMRVILHTHRRAAFDSGRDAPTRKRQQRERQEGGRKHVGTRLQYAHSVGPNCGTCEDATRGRDASDRCKDAAVRACE